MTAFQWLLIGVLIIGGIKFILSRTRPVTEEEEDFDIVEDHERGFDADYEPSSWHQKYEYLN